MPELLYSINPDRNIPWNDLPPLPIKEELYKTIEILEKLGNAKAALARLHGRSAVIPNQGLLINTISLQEAKTSTAIENIFTTDDELYKAYSEKNSESNTKSAPKEVLRYREALWSGYNYLQKENLFTRKYFIQVYQQIKQTTDEIRLPFSNTVIKQGGTGANAGKVVYTPPRGKGVIESKLDNLIDFVNDDEKYKIDHLLKMAIAHFQFEAIHPFTDGNGRTGRIFNIHYLTNKGLLDFPILYLSKYILAHKDDYYENIMGVSQRGNWKNWLLFMLKAIEVTSNNTFDMINDIVLSKNSILEYISSEGKFKDVEKLSEFLFMQPFIKVSHLVGGGLYAEGTARKYLNTLSDLRVLEKKNIGGKQYYLNNELYRILSK
ncbi:Fic/DOC family N-terminal domain-containing protein [Bernardetia sp. Wsw4-3y2]|uniref:Fic family protein n=1 Tax=unclassified Bernardetia TaxID=2647129 RepID=UPI0030D4676D